MTDGELEAAQARVLTVMRQLQRQRLLPPTDLWKGVPRTELDAHEREHGNVLPASYRMFMELAGNSGQSTKMFQSSGFWWPEPTEFREDVRDYYEGTDQDTDLGPDIPREATIILVHQGYCVMWALPDTIDTRVYAWPPNNGSRTPQVVAESFEEWLATFPFIL